jgi:hypothetical protein
MSAQILRTTALPLTFARVLQAWLSGLLRANMKAWLDYRSAVSPADRRHRLGIFVLYLSAAILPGGVVLILLRWFWLRLHW